MLTSAMLPGGNSRSVPSSSALPHPRATQHQERNLLTHCFQHLAHSFPRSLRSCAPELALTTVLSCACALFEKTTGDRGRALQRLFATFSEPPAGLCLARHSCENLFIPPLHPEAAESAQ